MLLLTDLRPVLGDRQALAYLTGRSVHTIRARCEVVRYRGRTPLYDVLAEAERLASIPTRNRDQASTQDQL